MTTFCTYFDSNFIDRGLCLWASLKKHMADARLLVFCLDDKVYEVLDGLRLGRAVTLIPIADVEALYPELKRVKPTRSRVEYIFTLTPSCIRFIFDRNPDITEVTYLDSDLLFFASPRPLFEEMDAKQASVGIIGHRFTPALKHLDVYGTYNVGWVSFRRTPSGLACLHDWQSKCIEWCHDKLDGERFADQKYLDAWPSRFDGVVEITHPGANVALWNLETDRITSGRRRIRVAGQPLIFYHFHGLSQFGSREFFTNVRAYNVLLNDMVRHEIYGPYMYRLRRAQRRLRSSDVHPLIRYKHSEDDLYYIEDNPKTGLFLTSVGPYGLHKCEAETTRWRRVIALLDSINARRPV